MIVPLPCPFCGIEPDVSGREYIGGIKGSARVECINEDCVANPVVESQKGYKFVVRDGAIMKWNGAIINTIAKLASVKKKR